MPPGNWSAEPITSPAADGACADPDCVPCKTMETGARVLCALVGVEWESLDAHAKSHYKAIVNEVFAAMSTALIELGAVREVASS